jgi:hypothetical protein
MNAQEIPTPGTRKIEFPEEKNMSNAQTTTHTE